MIKKDPVRLPTMHDGIRHLITMAPPSLRASRLPQPKPLPAELLALAAAPVLAAGPALKQGDAPVKQRRI